MLPAEESNFSVASFSIAKGKIHAKPAWEAFARGRTYGSREQAGGRGQKTGNRMRQALNNTKTPDRGVQLTPISYPLSTASNGVLTTKDVNNDDRTDYVYENKGNMTNCILPKSPFCTNNGPMAR
jgi:hypothetical protein